MDHAKRGPTNNAVNWSGYIFGDSSIKLMKGFSAIRASSDGPPTGYLGRSRAPMNS